MCLFAIYISSSQNVSSSLAHLVIALFGFLVHTKISLFLVDTSSFQMCLPSLPV